MDDNDYLLQQARADLAEVDSLIAEINSMTRDFQEELKEHQQEMAHEDEARARQARAGELGPDWKKLQERIDKGETSMAAILRGYDDSTAAENVRRTAWENADIVAEIQETEPEEGEEDEQGEQFKAVLQSQREIQDLIKEIKSAPVPPPAL